MKFLCSLVCFGLFASTVSSVPIARRDVNEALIPQFGFSSGVNPTGSGDCDGAVKEANGQPIKIPCSCPPDRSTFVKILNANVAAGHVLNNPSVPISFPEDGSKASQLARLNAASVTLQNLNGPGKGCPIVSTTFQAQAAAINAGTNTPPPATPSLTSTPVPASSSASPTPPSTSSAPTASQIEALAPPLGFTAGKNPTGTGDCDGAVNGADGKPIKVPCSCPPDQATFNKHLVSDVLAQHAVNNPTVKVSFPLDSSKASQLARLTAASVTLQNLFGPGKGCPVVSTTFQAQAAAINAGTNTPPPATPSPASTPAPASSPASPAPPSTPSAPTASQIEALAPPLGFTAGKNPTGTGDCDGAVNGADGKPIKVPCSCPPDQATFNKHLVSDVLAQHAVNNPTVKVSFPLDNSKASQLARLTAASVTLQNLFGPGKGCPIVSTTFQAQAAAINAGTAPPPVTVPSPSPSPSPSTSPKPASSQTPLPTPSPSSAPAPSPTPSSGSPSSAQIEALAPQLGFTAGKNPTGTGDCDGAVNGANGQPIKIPCSCPPDQTTFNQHLVGDVIASHAVNNPSVKVSYPLDNSVQSRLARVNTALVTLQNLFGPGKGCPAVSTTFSAQQAALLKQL